MRFRLWEQGIIKEENDVILKVYQEGDNVSIDIVDEEGRWEWNLAFFGEGKLNVCSCVSEDESSKGLQLDERGKIIVDD